MLSILHSVIGLFLSHRSGNEIICQFAIMLSQSGAERILAFFIFSSLARTRVV